MLLCRGHSKPPRAHIHHDVIGCDSCLAAGNRLYRNDSVYLFIPEFQSSRLQQEHSGYGSKLNFNIGRSIVLVVLYIV